MGIDYTSKDYESFRADMIRSLQTKIPEYTDTSQSDAGIVILELLAKGLDTLSFYQDVIANESLLPTQEQRSSALKWCSILGYIPKNATPSKVYQVFTLNKPLTYDLLIPKGTKISTLASTTESAIIFETSNDLVIPTGKLGNEFANGVYTYRVEAIQGTSVNGECLGSSTNTKDQSFVLSYSPVITESLQILVNEGSGFELWDAVESFVGSEPNSKNYTVTILDNDYVKITFGDNITGKIPVATTNGIFAYYRVGGGTQGNVGANKITALVNSVASVKSTFNPEVPFELGQDKETLEEIKVNAPNSYRTRWSVITLEDYEAKIKESFSQVKLVRAVKDGTDPKKVNVYLVLKDLQTVTEDLCLNIEEELADKIIIGTSVDVKNTVQTLNQNFVIKLSVLNGFTLLTVQQEITAFLRDYFTLGNYPFGQELSLTSLEATIRANVEGIYTLRFTTPSLTLVTPSNIQLITCGSITYTE